MTSTVLLEAQDLSRSFAAAGGQIDAVRNVSLQLRAGEIVAVVGSSGSGKTTLLQMLGGLDTPSAGSVRFGSGEGESGKRRDVGVIFQQFNLIPTLTARENVLAALAPAGVRGRSARERASELLRLVGLADRERNLPTRLSGGEQQRVAIARALANDPTVLLADEPTGNLDSATGLRVIELLESLVRDRERTLLIVTHDDELAARADRVLRMHDGVLSHDPARPSSVSAASPTAMPAPNSQTDPRPTVGRRRRRPAALVRLGRWIAGDPPGGAS